MIRWLVTMAALGACTPADAPSQPELPDAWRDCGVVLEAGQAGEWDHVIWGGFASGLLVRKDGLLLYYQGSSGYDEAGGTVTNRAVGLALSTDGVQFTKYHSNPVLTFSPGQNIEEGAVSTAFLPDDDGGITVFYGANRWVGGNEVTADGRIARSSEGLRYVDEGVVLSHLDADLWGSGDEIFPVAAHRYRDRTLIYYIPNGTAESGRLGVWWSDGSSARGRSGAVGDQRGTRVQAWGPASIVAASAGTFVLFTSDVRREPGMLQARVMSVALPAHARVAPRRYDLDGRIALGVARSSEGAWHLAYRTPDHGSIGMMMSPDCAALPGQS